VRALAGNPEIDVVRGNFGENQAALARPRGSFQPFIEATDNLFRFRAGRDDLVERGIEYLDFL